jgi:hypothetical protein
MGLKRQFGPVPASLPWQRSIKKGRGTRATNLGTFWARGIYGVWEGLVLIFRLFGGPNRKGNFANLHASVEGGVFR